jgi:large conductance mechanosensitive channel protein
VAAATDQAGRPGDGDAHAGLRYRPGGGAIREPTREPRVLNDFKKFLFRGNVIDLAVAVVIGAAFAAIVAAFSTGILTPLIGMVIGKDLTEMTFTINRSAFSYGIVLDAAIRFVATAAVVFFFVVKPMQVLARAPGAWGGDRGHAGPERRGRAPHGDPRPAVARQ